ncbi:hypothetical protein [Wolbachia endosymbiont of Ctenocephalides felis wCfeT]|uniref:hypothetical protein n=1 Tax=Wolbachia endosymbiont of Ctenocephalides felis wCfeT TaxID=2732593 RepID=UPI00144802A0|nr:hypothetical protein [Wolbachia endosymbiont of Ctenocephalides felis wCfeT]
MSTLYFTARLNGYSNTALHIAISFKLNEAVKILLTHQDINFSIRNQYIIDHFPYPIQRYNHTVLEYARELGTPEIVNEIVRCMNERGIREGGLEHPVFNIGGEVRDVVQNRQNARAAMQGLDMQDARAVMQRFAEENDRIRQQVNQQFAERQRQENDRIRQQLVENARQRNERVRQQVDEIVRQRIIRPRVEVRQRDERRGRKKIPVLVKVSAFLLISLLCMWLEYEALLALYAMAALSFHMYLLKKFIFMGGNDNRNSSNKKTILFSALVSLYCFAVLTDMVAGKGYFLASQLLFTIGTPLLLFEEVSSTACSVCQSLELLQVTIAACAGLAMWCAIGMILCSLFSCLCNIFRGNLPEDHPAHVSAHDLMMMQKEAIVRARLAGNDEVEGVPLNLLIDIDVGPQRNRPLLYN